MNKKLITSALLGLSLMLPVNAYASSLYILDGVDQVEARENKNITKLDFIKILLEKDGFNGIIDVPEDRKFQDVKADDETYVEKMRQLGVISRNHADPLLEPDRELYLWRTLQMLFKYEGVNVKQFLIQKDNFEKTVNNISGDNFMAPIFEKAIELGLVKPVNGKIAFLSKVDLDQFLFMVEQLQNDRGISTSKSSVVINPLTDMQKQQKYQILENVWNRIKKDFVFNSDVDETKLMYGAIEGMVEALDDPFSTFQVPKE